MRRFIPNFAIFVFTLQFIETFLENIVVNTTIQLSWSSQTFKLQAESAFDYDWQICRKFSKIYCLNGFETTEELSEPAFVSIVNLMYSGHMHYSYYWLAISGYRRSKNQFRSMYTIHNFFTDREGCCYGQYQFYFVSGFKKMLLAPSQYIEKLTNYSDENKHLNAIWAFFDHDCNVNVITKLGFGAGQLKRFNHGVSFKSEKEDTPYQLRIGENWSHEVSYENPGQFITFRWFKWNVICLEQPWVCI